MKTSGAGGAIHSKDTMLKLNNKIKFEDVVSEYMHPIDLTEEDLGRCAQNDNQEVSKDAFTVLQLECSNKQDNCLPI